MRQLREGDRGAVVDMLQWGLTRARWPLRADGVFGNKTLRAVQAFQGQNGLAPDGVAGDLTWAALTPYITGQALPGRPIVPTAIRWSSDLLTLVVEGLGARYPFLASETIGSSAMGKPIQLMRIGEGARRVGYNATHHANEWITTPLLLKFLERYAACYVRGGTLGWVPCARLYREFTLEIVPMVNPDGVDLVTDALSHAAPEYLRAVQIAAAFPRIPFPLGWKANIEGIDLNLGYPAGWELAREIKYAQGFVTYAPRDFVGPYPLAAPESAAMYRHALQAGYELILAYHTQGELIFWRYEGFDPPGAYQLARRMETASGYAMAETPPGSSHAGYRDWFITRFNRPGFTIEAGRGTSPLPLSQFDQIYRDNIGILLLGMAGLL
ncbi:MAG: peptidoglycan-binding protein [Oscillospiraceae bacterium]|nr:peptidoglycan-binding protein [Oscillospiraceae bacterium]